MKENALLCLLFCLYVTSFNIAGCCCVFVVAVPGPKMSDSVDVSADVAVTATALSLSFVYIRFVQTHKGNAYTNRPHYIHTQACSQSLTHVYARADPAELFGIRNLNVICIIFVVKMSDIAAS